MKRIAFIMTDMARAIAGGFAGVGWMFLDFLFTPPSLRRSVAPSLRRFVAGPGGDAMKQSLLVTLTDETDGMLEQYRFTVDALDVGSDERLRIFMLSIEWMLRQMSRRPNIAGFTIKHYRLDEPEAGEAEQPMEAA